MITHEDYKKKLTTAQRARVDELARKLIAEEKSLREIRKARDLGMAQGDLSKFERRTDAYLSTIRRYVEAMGGTLELIATFPDTGPVKIANIGSLDDGEDQEEEQKQLA
jgi:hypothetical protein